MMEGSKMTGNVNALTEKAYRFTNTGPEEISVPDMYPAATSRRCASL